MSGVKLSAEVKHQIRAGIDAVMLMESLTQQGWTRTDLPRFESNEQAVDIQHWAQENCSGKYHSFGRHWIFELQEDAVMFQLRWA